MCLYALELAWHPSFNPTARQCYLPFRHPNNRPFYTALTRHMQSLSRRGLHGTALEVAKLILSLDPEDPVGLLTSIDYYALRAQQYGFVMVGSCLPPYFLIACHFGGAHAFGLVSGAAEPVWRWDYG